MNTISINQLISADLDNPYPVLQINEASLNHNLQLIQKIAGENVKILIPVKANAYGVGLRQIIPYLLRAKPEYIGVANPYEGSLSRKYGWKGSILNLGGFYPEVAGLFFEHRIMPSITDLWQIETLHRIAHERNENIDVHIKLDLGMGRLGIQKSETGELVQQIKSRKNLIVKGIFTHFPSADQLTFESNRSILAAFNETIGMILEELALSRKDILLHAANSCALMLNAGSHFDMVRPGLSFYGYFSDMAEKEKLAKEFPFKPSLNLLAKPIAVRTLPRGASISYGETYHVKDEFERVGVIPVGYADGIPRRLSNDISFDGHPLLGRVSMDQIVVGKIKAEDESPIIELLGENSPPLEYWAEKAGTVTYEIMTRLGERIRRKLV